MGTWGRKLVHAEGNLPGSPHHHPRVRRHLRPAAGPSFPLAVPTFSLFFCSFPLSGCCKLLLSPRLAACWAPQPASQRGQLPGGSPGWQDEGGIAGGTPGRLGTALPVLPPADAGACARLAGDAAGRLRRGEELLPEPVQGRGLPLRDLHSHRGHRFPEQSGGRGRRESEVAGEFGSGRAVRSQAAQKPASSPGSGGPPRPAGGFPSRPPGAVSRQIWDTAGQERFRSVTHAYYRDAQGGSAAGGTCRSVSPCRSGRSNSHCLSPLPALLLLYDITSKISFDNIRADMSGERAVRTEDGASLAREYGVPFMETSAKTGLNVELAFLAVANSSPAARSRCRGAAAAGRCCTWESWDDAQLQRLRPTGIFPGPEPALPPLTCPGAALASAPLAGLSLQVYRIKAQYFRGLASACFSMREKALTPGRDVGGCRAGAAAEAGDPGGRRSPFLLARAYAADFRQSKGERGRVNTAC
ncbi:ras-related protein Rab-37 isoform X2 [Apteryx mantelli]|uniref:small monomeric GTPase n=1 Tax=Apteryx mantelli TaxID=2696672 RepID=A0ABM4FHX2_9AVES